MPLWQDSDEVCDSECVSHVLGHPALVGNSRFVVIIIIDSICVVIIIIINFLSK